MNYKTAKKRPGRKKKPEHLKRSGQARYIPLALLETVDKMIEEYYERRGKFSLH